MTPPELHETHHCRDCGAAITVPYVRAGAPADAPHLWHGGHGVATGGNVPAPVRGALDVERVIGLDWLLIFDRAFGGDGNGTHGRDRFAFNANVARQLRAALATAPSTPEPRTMYRPGEVVGWAGPDPSTPEPALDGLCPDCKHSDDEHVHYCSHEYDTGSCNCSVEYLAVPRKD